MSADTADLILSNDWLVRVKLCSDWLLNLLKEEFQGCDRQTDKQIDLIDCWTASFTVKNILGKFSPSSLAFCKRLAHWDSFVLSLMSNSLHLSTSSLFSFIILSYLSSSRWIFSGSPISSSWNWLWVSCPYPVIIPSRPWGLTGGPWSCWHSWYPLSVSSTVT